MEELKRINAKLAKKQIVRIIVYPEEYASMTRKVVKQLENS